MPRKTPIPESELAVSRRLRDVRRATKLSRVAFAAELGIDATRLASYEHGRVPLRYAIADRLCRRFDINQRWLATGELPMRRYFALAAELEARLEGGKSFTVVYSREMKNHFDERWGMLSMEFKDKRRTIPADDPALTEWPKVGAPSREYDAQILRSTIEEAIQGMDDKTSNDYILFMMEMSEGFMTGFAQKKPGPKNKALTTSGISGKSFPVALSLEQLYADVLAVTPHGKKSALADYLKVSPSRLSEWFSGLHEPGAEVALRMLAWVEEHKGALNKTSRSASTPREAKTRNERKSSEKSKGPKPKE